jgi:hypothetical protein
MGTAVYFGANNPSSPINGNWQDITQWYSNPGFTGESTLPSTKLNRFPNPATDDVYIYQDVKTNVATYVGTYPNGSWTTDKTYSGLIYGRNAFRDPNAIWTGTIYNGNCQSGTFTGNFITNQGLTLTIAGGNFTNANFSQVIRLSVAESNATVSGGNNTIQVPDTLTFPTNFSLSPNLQYIILQRQMAWNYPILFSSDTGGQLQIRRGALTNELPTISQNISTSVTNCLQIDFTFNTRATTNGANIWITNLLVDLDTILTNPAPLIFGSPTKPISFTLTYVAPNREITAYVSDTTASVIYCGGLTPRYDKLNIIEIAGSRGAYIRVESAVTWAPTLNIPLTNTNDFSKYKLGQLPRSYDFSRYSYEAQAYAKFEPIINLQLTKNVVAVLE